MKVQQTKMMVPSNERGHARRRATEVVQTIEAPYKPVRSTVFALSLAILLLSATNAFAQVPNQFRREVFGMAGWSHVFRVEDFSDNGFQFGGGFRWRFTSKLGGEFAVHSVAGLSPQPVRCGGVGESIGGMFVPLPCVGTARTGVNSLTDTSMNLLYYFADAGVQPYATGGIGTAWSQEFTATFFTSPGRVLVVEGERRRASFAWNAGAGLHIPVGARLFLSPDVRVMDTSALSRLNLSAFRAAVSFGYRW